MRATTLRENVAPYVRLLAKRLALGADGRETTSNKLRQDGSARLALGRDQGCRYRRHRQVGGRKGRVVASCVTFQTKGGASSQGPPWSLTRQYEMNGACGKSCKRTSKAGFQVDIAGSWLF